MAKILVVDRIEDDIAVCEVRDCKKMIEVNLSRLPENVKEGTVLKYEMDTFFIDKQAEEEIENRIQEKMDDIWEN